MMKRRTFQPASGGSAPAQPATRSPHIVLRVILIVFVLLFLAEFVPAPWAFHIGSRFTPLGQWDGYGRVQASNGGRYLLFTHLQGGVPAHGGRPGCALHGGCNTLRGSAQVCTESGRVYAFSLAGKMHGWLTTDGSLTELNLSGGSAVPLPGGLVVAFHGIWQGPVLPVASTDGSFTEAFSPAGAVRKSLSAANAGTATGTLRYGSADAFSQACHTLAARARLCGAEPAGPPEAGRWLGGPLS
ncbi:MAG TPA: hypothetical protein VEC76_17785 [Streptosporangiaceae bacterium]|nr:hypothetical protein [Streptosporangiaceae bacterium]